jgi:hypothetical protein
MKTPLNVPRVRLLSSAKYSAGISRLTPITVSIQNTHINTTNSAQQNEETKHETGRVSTISARTRSRCIDIDEINHVGARLKKTKTRDVHITKTFHQMQNRKKKVQK